MDIINITELIMEGRRDTNKHIENGSQQISEDYEI